MHRIYLLLITYCLSLIAVAPVQAQNTPVDLANLYEIADSKASDGDVLVYSEKGIVRADAPYANRLFGILQDKPVFVYRLPQSKGKPVVRTGTAYVNVTDFAGGIKAGDYITSSRTSGKGQKAEQSGYVLGIALEELKGKSGKIAVAVRIEYAELTNTRSVLRLLDYFNIAAFESSADPDKASQFVQYTSSGLIVILALIVSFVIFGRSLVKSIEAIGRNPLAKNAIQLSLLINVAFTIVIILIAVAAAFIILQL